MASERGKDAGAVRRVPLATPFGRLVQGRGETRAVILSAAVHLGIVLALLWGGTRLVMDSRAPGPGHGKGGGGGGGGPRTLVLYVAPAPPPAPRPAAVVPPPQQLVVHTVPVPVPVVKPPDSTPPAAVTGAAAAGPGTGPGTGAGQGPGSGGGSGGGAGGGVGPGLGADSGAGGTVYPPQPLGIIMPPVHPPSKLRGTTITVVFEISETGDVTHVGLDPTPADHQFAKDFLDRLRQYTFSPAHTLDGHPVAGLVRITFTL